MKEMFGKQLSGAFKIFFDWVEDLFQDTFLHILKKILSFLSWYSFCSQYSPGIPGYLKTCSYGSIKIYLLKYLHLGTCKGSIRAMEKS